MYWNFVAIDGVIRNQSESFTVDGRPGWLLSATCVENIGPEAMLPTPKTRTFLYEIRVKYIEEQCDCRGRSRSNYRTKILPDLVRNLFPVSTYFVQQTWPQDKTLHCFYCKHAVTFQNTLRNTQNRWLCGLSPPSGILTTWHEDGNIQFPKRRVF
jgi:hypothetical protein